MRMRLAELRLSADIGSNESFADEVRHQCSGRQQFGGRSLCPIVFSVFDLPGIQIPTAQFVIPLPQTLAVLPLPNFAF